jgi:hypothetical protein
MLDIYDLLFATNKNNLKGAKHFKKEQLGNLHSI